MKVTIAHPGPVRHTGPRARVERLSFDALETEVDIPEVSHEEMRDIGRIDERGDRFDSQPIHVLEASGAFWVFVRDGNLNATPMVVAERMLAGRSWDRGWASMPAVLHRSPLHVPGNRDHHRANRGTRIEPSRLGTIAEDFRDAAQKAVADYAADNLRVRAGMLLVRLPGPLAVRTDDHQAATFRLSAHPFRYAQHWLDTLCLPGMLQETYMFRDGADARPGSVAKAGTRRATLMESDIRGPLPDGLADFLRFNANAGVLFALDGISRFLRDDAFAPDEQRWVTAAYRSAAAEIGAFLPLASITAIPAERHVATIEAVAGALSRAEASMPRATPSGHWVTRHRRWLTDVVLPFARSPVPEEDTAALSELSP